VSAARRKAVAADRPLTLLIAALGGECGGVLTDWIVAAAMAEGYPVQSTSIPGVAQRTGATTYYIEIFPQPVATLDGRSPVMALYPGPGNVDIMVASEIIEAGRAMEQGFVSPDRTTLIAATHRVYAIVEKSAMGDGSYDTRRIAAAAPKLAKRAILFDFAAIARRHGTMTNAVLLGVIAGCGRFPFSVDAFEAAVRARGVAVAPSLAGFAAGLACVRGEVEAAAADAPPPRSWARRRTTTEALLGQLPERFPAPCRAVLEEGVRRVADFQDPAHAETYLERVAAVLDADRAGDGGARDFALTREAARHLALWMSYEDVIRVAELKSRGARFAALRREVGAKPEEPVRITEFLKPGVEEVGALLPPFLGRPLLRWAQRRGVRLNISMHIRSDTVFGYLRLRMLARIKGWRRHTTRFAEEEALIARWLAAITAAARRDYDLALEIVACAKLLKGYGETHGRGRRSFETIFSGIVAPALAGDDRDAAARTRRAREAALADPEGASLAAAMTALAAPSADADRGMAAE